MGGKWTSFNGMTERFEFLYIQRTFVEEFRQSWSLYQAHSDKMLGDGSSPAVQPLQDGQVPPETQQPF
jgi:hypothetical protein